MRIPDLSDIPELGPVAPDTEYDLRIVGAKNIQSKRTGREAALFICEILGEENAENVLHSLWLPMESDDASKQKTMWRMVKEFLSAVGLPTDGFELEDAIGTEFSAILSLGEDDKGRKRNEILRVT
jgi:hypothetical protein